MMRLYPLFIVLILASCELFELPLKVDPADEALVISSVMIDDETMIVTATRSFSPLSGRSVNALEDDLIASLFVSDGRILVTNSSTTDTLPTLGIPGFYGGESSESEAGSLIYLSVYDSTTGLSVEASAIRMEAISIDTSTYEDVRIGALDLKRLRVWIDDPIGPNYFALHVYNVPLGGDELDSLFFRNSDLLLHSEVFTDRVAEEGRIRRQIDMDPRIAGDTVIVVLSNIEEGYYRFLDARRRTGGLIASLANEPINAPTNIIGGYGYFSAHQLRATIVIMEDD